MRNLTFGFMLLLLAAVPVHAEELPSLHQVYQNAQAGRVEEALRQIDQVLQDYPKSGKAHYVKAELLASLGRMTQARGELENAERLSPDLTFAKLEAVRALRAKITSASSTPAPVSASQSHPAATGTGTGKDVPWGMLLLGGAALLLILAALRGARKARDVASPSPTRYSQGPNAAGPYGGGYDGAAPSAPSASAGMGSRIMGGLATGAAVGAGIVAGEALANHFLGDGKDQPHLGNTGSNHTATPLGDRLFSPPDDMGGNDFGIVDNANWDDAGGFDGGVNDDADWS